MNCALCYAQDKRQAARFRSTLEGLRMGRLATVVEAVHGVGWGVRSVIATGRVRASSRRLTLGSGREQRAHAGRTTGARQTSAASSASRAGGRCKEGGERPDARGQRAEGRAVWRGVQVGAVAVANAGRRASASLLHGTAPACIKAQQGSVIAGSFPR